MFRGGVYAAEHTLRGSERNPFVKEVRQDFFDKQSGARQVMQTCRAPQPVEEPGCTLSDSWVLTNLG